MFPELECPGNFVVLERKIGKTLSGILKQKLTRGCEVLEEFLGGRN